MKVIELVKKCFRNNESGFSLAELMVAAGIVGVISVALMRIMTQATQTQKKVTTDMTINETFISMQNILRNEGNCTEIFGGRSYAANILPKGPGIVKYTFPSDYIYPNNPSAPSAIQTYGVYGTATAANSTIGLGTDGSAYITKIAISSNPGPTPIVAGRGEITLDVTFSRMNPGLSGAALASAQKRVFGGRTVRKQIKIQVDIIGGLITKCNADLSDYQEQFCKTALQGTWNGTICESIKISDGGATGNAIDTEGNIILNAGALIVDSSTQLDTNKLGFAGAAARIGLMPVGQLNQPNPTYTNSMQINADDMTFQKSIIVAADSTIGGDETVTGSVTVGGDLKVNRDIYSTSSGGVLISGATSPMQYPSLWVRPSGGSIEAAGVSSTTVPAFHVARGYGQIDTVPSSYFPLAAADRLKMVNAGWVDTYITEGLAANMAGSGSNVVADLLSKMAAYTTNQPMNAVAAYSCGRITIRNKAGVASTRSVTKGTNGLCTFDTPDTNCNTAGTCSSVCIGNDCRNTWPISPDTTCQTSGTCNQLCIGAQCMSTLPYTIFALYNSSNCKVETSYEHSDHGLPIAFCSGQAVVRGLRIFADTSPLGDSSNRKVEILCCKSKMNYEREALWR
ncbi:MAG: type II secretion system protein [Bacteriovoracaceae bacterium]|nr:type II secretion system protein [Bacteriovoracaceae bacterium]